MLSVIIVLLGIASTLLMSLAFSYFAEVTYPIKSVLPHLLVILLSTVTFLVINRKGVLLYLIPLVISVFSVSFIEDSSSEDTDRLMLTEKS